MLQRYLYIIKQRLLLCRAVFSSGFLTMSRAFLLFLFLMSIFPPHSISSYRCKYTSKSSKIEWFQHTACVYLTDIFIQSFNSNKERSTPRIILSIDVGSFLQQMQNNSLCIENNQCNLHMQGFDLLEIRLQSVHGEMLGVMESSQSLGQ